MNTFPELQIVTSQHQDLIDSSLRQNTRKAYAQDLANYIKFTGTDKIERELVLLFLKHLKNKGRKWATIKRAAYGLGVTGINTQLKGLRNQVFEQDVSKVVAKKARPLLKDGLIAVCNQTELSEKELLIIKLLWFGALRVSEVVNLKKSQFLRTENYYLLTLHTSKNVKRGDTVSKLLPYSDTESICPVQALDSYSKNLSNNDYLFPGRSGGHITTRAIQKMVKRVLGDSYQSHSMRRGVLTEGFQQGCTVSQLMHLSSHSHIASLMEYDSTDMIKNNAISKLA